MRSLVRIIVLVLCAPLAVVGQSPQFVRMTLERTLPIAPSAPGVGAPRILDADLGRDRNVYVLVDGERSVRVYEGQVLRRRLGKEGSSARCSPALAPVALEIGRDGRIYVLDEVEASIRVYDYAGTCHREHTLEPHIRIIADYQVDAFGKHVVLGYATDGLPLIHLFDSAFSYVASIGDLPNTLNDAPYPAREMGFIDADDLGRIHHAFDRRLVSYDLTSISAEEGTEIHLGSPRVEPLKALRSHRAEGRSVSSFLATGTAHLMTLGRSGGTETVLLAESGEEATLKTLPVPFSLLDQDPRRGLLLAVRKLDGVELLVYSLKMN